MAHSTEVDQANFFGVSDMARIMPFKPMSLTDLSTCTPDPHKDDK